MFYQFFLYSFVCIVSDQILTDLQAKVITCAHVLQVIEVACAMRRSMSVTPPPVCMVHVTITPATSPVIVGKLGVVL